MKNKIASLRQWAVLSTAVSTILITQINHAAPKLDLTLSAH